MSLPINVAAVLHLFLLYCDFFLGSHMVWVVLLQNAIFFWGAPKLDRILLLIRRSLQTQALSISLEGGPGDFLWYIHEEDPRSITYMYIHIHMHPLSLSIDMASTITMRNIPQVLKLSVAVGQALLHSRGIQLFGAGHSYTKPRTALYDLPRWFYTYTHTLTFLFVLL